MASKGASLLDALTLGTRSPLLVPLAAGFLRCFIEKARPGWAGGGDTDRALSATCDAEDSSGAKAALIRHGREPKLEKEARPKRGVIGRAFSPAR